MVDKVPYSIHRVKPRTVRVLAFQDEIQISFCDFPVVFGGQELRGARQQESAIGGSINNSAFIKRRVGRTAGLFRRLEILDVSGGVSCDRFKDQFPLFSWVQLEDLKDRFLTVGSRSDEWRLFLDCAVPSDPIKGITPAIFLKVRAALFFVLG